MKTCRLLAGLFALALAFSFTACSDRLGDGLSHKGQDTTPDGTPVDVTFHIGDIRCATKSSFSTDEDEISNLSLLVYKNDNLVSSAYTQDVNGDVIILRLAKGEQYNIYALANCGEVEFQDESDLLEYRYQIPSLSSLNDGFPMCWSSIGYTVATSLPDVNIELERLVAKVTFSLDPGVLDGLEVTSVRLMQSSKAVCPFGINRKAMSSSEVMAGDYASSTDLAAINQGRQIVMYIPENCQGTLLEGNTNPWNKIPDNIDGKGGVCTYIEVSCSFNEGFALTGSVIYRMYVGADNCANFDVVRNSIYSLALTLTGDGLNEVSWKVDSDVDYNGSVALARAWIEAGLHQNTNLYIGEIFYMGFDLHPSLDKLVCEKIGRNEIGVRSANGVLAPCSEIFIDEEQGYYFTEIGCLDFRNDGLELYDKTNGSKICHLMDCSIKRPGLRISSSSTAEEIPSSLSSVTPTINGTPTKVYAYLVDNNGTNLLSSDQYSFNTSLYEDLFCSIATNNSTYSTALCDCGATKDFVSEESIDCHNQAIASFAISLNIPLPSHQVSPMWAKLWSSEQRGEVPLKFNFSTSKILTATNVNGYFDIIQPTITWDLLNESTLSIINPSNIEIVSELWEIAPSSEMINKNKYTAVTTSGYSGLSTPFGNTQLQPLYIHKVSHSFACENPNDLTTNANGEPVYIYTISQDYPQEYSSSVGGVKVVMSTIDGIPFEYNFSCISEDDNQYPTGDDGYPVVYRYDDYYSPHTSGIFASTITARPVRRQRNIFQQGVSATAIFTYSPGISNYIFADLVEMYELKSSRPHAKINLTYSPQNGIVASVIDPYNINYNICVEDGIVSGTCKWRSYSTQSYKTDTHSLPLPLSSVSQHTGEYKYPASMYKSCTIAGSNSVCISQSDITDVFQNLNVGCWHNASEKAVASSSNRRSNFTLPGSLTLNLQANGETRMVPIDIVSNITAITTDVVGAIYESTYNGTYSKDYFGDFNMDGTDRDRKNVNGEVVVSGSTAIATNSKSYTLTVGTGETMTKTFTYYVR